MSDRRSSSTSSGASSHSRDQTTHLQKSESRVENRTPSENKSSVEHRVSVNQNKAEQLFPIDERKPHSVVYSGPDGMYDHRIHVTRTTAAIGAGDNSPELSGDLAYLVRAPPGAPFPKSRGFQVGEIGWGVTDIRV